MPRPSALQPPTLGDELQIRAENGVEVWEVPTSAKTRYLSHDYFRYIGKFPPQIARRLILDYSKPGELVLDPMCGGGTTLIEARLSGRRSVGIDVNPVSVLVSSVVSRQLEQRKLGAAVHAFLEELGEALSPQAALPLVQRASSRRQARLPDMHGHEKYFDQETLRGLAVFFELLSTVRVQEHRDFLLVSLLAILRSVSHANVKKMNLELDLKKETRRPLLAAVTSKLARMLDANAELAEAFAESAAEVREGSADETGLGDGSVDLVVVHPPYLTNTAFSEATQLQLAVLGISHLTIWRRELRARGSFLHEPNGVTKYILGWNRILKEAHRVLRKGGHCAVVVGDGQIDYTRFPIGAITEELASDIGFSVVRKARHHLNHNTGKTQSRKMRDQHIVVLKK